MWTRQFWWAQISYRGVPGTCTTLSHAKHRGLFVSLRWIASILCAPQRTNYCHAWRWTSSVKAVLNPTHCTYNTKVYTVAKNWAQKQDTGTVLVVVLHLYICSWPYFVYSTQYPTVVILGNARTHACTHTCTHTQHTHTHTHTRKLKESRINVRMIMKDCTIYQVQVLVWKVQQSAPPSWQKKGASRPEENLYLFVFRLARNRLCRRENIIAEAK